MGDPSADRRVGGWAYLRRKKQAALSGKHERRQGACLPINPGTPCSRASLRAPGRPTLGLGFASGSCALRLRRAGPAAAGKPPVHVGKAMKLSKQQAKAHECAVEMLTKPMLTLDERYFVIEHWNPAADPLNCLTGAFFTPPGLARDFAIEVSGRTLVDLCAGIGALSFYASIGREGPRSIVCVESNPVYVAVGQKILPEATWLCCDVFQLPEIGHFQCAIANPPFGAARRNGRAPRYHGARFEYHVIDVASDLADDGVFLLPQDSSPFRYSGRPYYEQSAPERIPHYGEFVEATGIELESTCGIDTSLYIGDWKGVSPATEVVICDFAVARLQRARGTSGDLFSPVGKETSGVR